MILKVLGSAAAEGWPATFCTCPGCQTARRLQGRNIRRRTSYQLGDEIHIDWGPDSYYSMHSFDIDYSPLSFLLITHSHFDHWMPIELRWRREGFSVLPEDSWLTVYGNRAVRERAEDELLPKLENGFDELKLDIRLFETFRTLDLGTARVTPLPANHADEEDAHILLLETDNASTLIAHDTGWFSEEVWEFLAGREIAYVLIDCTYGSNDKSTGHMGGSYVIETATRMRETNALNEDGVAIAQHFSHNCRETYQQLHEYFAPHHLNVAYDGMELEM